jgi:predicted nucleic acid-binding protein
VILVDTSVWVDHLRASNAMLVRSLNAAMVLAHPFVTGELALGNLGQRGAVLSALTDLPQAIVATDTEVLHFIDRHELFGRGVGYIDVHLLAAVRLTAGAELWTRDRRLHGTAVQLGLASPSASIRQHHPTAIR